jgi:hypothetical protein
MVLTIQYLGIKLDVYGKVLHEKATQDKPSYWDMEVDSIELTTDCTNLKPFLEGDLPKILDLCKEEYFDY